MFLGTRHLSLTFVGDADHEDDDHSEDRCPGETDEVEADALAEHQVGEDSSGGTSCSARPQNTGQRRRLGASEAGERACGDPHDGVHEDREQSDLLFLSLIIVPTTAGDSGPIESPAVRPPMGDTLGGMGGRVIEAWLLDMDGVLVTEGTPVPGADEFVGRVADRRRPFLVLTNNSIYTRRDLAARLAHAGLQVPEERIWTSAMATAQFLSDQMPEASAHVIGEAGLTTALHEVGFTLTATRPDFVVLGETRTYSFEAITDAIRLIERGARFIATNPDATGPSPEGPVPATGSVAALITRATGVEPYFVGKPNPMMFRSAMNQIDAHSETTAMVGDRMDTDIVAGIEAGLTTFLVLTGSTRRAEVERYPYRPSRIAGSIAELIDLV